MPFLTNYCYFSMQMITKSIDTCIITMYNDTRGDQMIRKQIYIDNEQDVKVKEVSDKLGVSEAEIIRRAITKYLETKQREEEKC